MAVAKIDDAELMTLLSHTGLKDLDSFKTQAMLSRLTKKFEALLATDAITAYCYLGMIESYRNNNVRALEFMEKGLRLASNDLVLLNNYAKTWEHFGNYDKAKEITLKILELDPMDQHNFYNLLSTANYFFDIDLIDVLKKMNEIEFEKAINEIQINLSQTLIDYKILKAEKFDFECYKIQLSSVFKVIQKYFNSSASEMIRYFNDEDGYLVTIIQLSDMTVDILDMLRNEYETELFNYAESQTDGGFAFFKKLRQSVIQFDFMDERMELNHAM